jgi:hypothetical protein
MERGDEALMWTMRSLREACCRHTIAVVARLDRATQYAVTLRLFAKLSGIPGHPLEPVIGLAEGETRWRVMTTKIVEQQCVRRRRVASH